MAIRDWLLLADERENPHTRIDAGKRDGVGWTTGNSVRPLVHGRPYMAELYEHIGELVAGDRFYFVDWQGDPGQQLTDDPSSTLSHALVEAALRGVEVRGLLWRSHWKRLGFGAGDNLELGEAINEAGGQCLRDMRVRFRGAHHQKFVVVRHADDPTRDVAYVGGIDLCHSRRDDADHHGDPQANEMAAAYGPTPPWHDVQVAIRGPAVHDVETTFRERWEDSTPLTLNPGRLASSLARGEELSPEPLGDQWDPPPATDGHEAVQVLRTFPIILPEGFDFAPEGERSVMLGNSKAIRRAERLVYVEDQYFWGEDVGHHFAAALRENPDLRMVIVLPLVPDEDGPLAIAPQLHGRSLAMDLIFEAAGPERVAVFGLTNDEGLPIYVHSKTCIVDHRWASIGSDNLNRRSWTSDSEISVTIVDARTDADGDHDAAAPDDAFPRRLLRELVAEHLGCPPEQVPEDPHELFDAMVACADALDEWYGGGEPDPETGVRGRISAARSRVHLPGRGRARTRARAAAASLTEAAANAGERPPGRLRRLTAPRLTAAQRLWAPRLYERVFDPEGRDLAEED